MKTIASNTGISIVSRTLGLILAFFSLGVVTRYLGPEKAGEYFTVLAYAGVFSVIAELGLYQILLRNISRPGADEVGIFSSFFSLRIVSLIAVLGVLAPAAAVLFPYAVSVKLGIAVAAAAYICLSLVTLFVALFQKHLRMHAVAVGELASRSVQLALAYILLSLGKGVLAALVAILAASALHAAILSLWARRIIPYRFHIDISSWKNILRQSYPVALSAVFSFIYFKIDTLMLSVMQPPRDVGLYGLAYKLLEVLVAYPAIYVGLLLPTLAGAFVADPSAYKASLKRGFKALSLVAFPMLAGGVLLAHRIIPLFGEGYEAAIPALQVLLGATFMIFYGTLYSNVLIVVDRQKTLATIYFFGMIGNIAANVYAIPRWSFMGAAWTTMLTEFFVTIAMVVLLARRGQCTADVAALRGVVASTAMMALTVYSVRGEGVVAGFLVGVLSYAAALLLFRVVHLNEIASVLGMRSKERAM